MSVTKRKLALDKQKLVLNLPTLSVDSFNVVKGGWTNPYSANGWWDCNPNHVFVLPEIVITPDDPPPGNDPVYGDPFYNPYDTSEWYNYGDPDDGGGGSGPGTNPSTPSYFGGTGEAIDIANGNATAAEANAYYDKFSDATAATGILAGVQGLKADALQALVKSTTGELGTVKTLSAYGKAWGIVGVAVGAVDLYYAFSDGDISNTDIINAVGVGLGVVGLIASGPIGIIAGGISLGIGIWSAASGGGSSSGGSSGGGGGDDYGY